MPELRWYLFVRPDRKDTIITVHRASAEVFTEWAKYETSTMHTGLLFVGESRPGASEVEELFELAPGKFLISEPARWLLPSRHEVASRPIGHLRCASGYQSMPVFVGRLGWGYELPPDSDLNNLFHAEQGRLQEAEILATNKEFLETLDPSILEDPFQLARIASEWAGDVQLETLNLTVRCSNVLKDQSITTIADLAALNTREALRWSKFGVKSIKDLSESLIHFLRLCPHPIRFSKGLVGAPSQNELRDASSQVGGVSLLEEMERSLLALPSKYRAVVEGRFAIYGPKRTLEEIASDLGVTRERVRQIEAKFLRSAMANPSWVRRSLNVLSQLRIGRTAPLYADLLEADDPWFIGLSDKLPFVVELVGRFGLEYGQKVCWVKGRPVIASVDSDQWDRLKTRVLQYLQSRTEMGMTRTEVGLALEGLLTTDGCPELYTEFAAEISEYLQFGRQYSGAEEHLVDIGRGIARQLRSILEQSDSPLHYSHLHALYISHTGTETSVRSVHAALSRSGALYYGRGVYGTWRHFPLPAPEREQVRIEAEGLLEAATPHKQWHIQEVLTLLNECRPDFSEDLNKYVLNIVLGMSVLLKPVGRFVWTRVGGIGSSAHDRIEIMHTCIGLLSRAGGPLTTGQLRDELARVRGVGEFFLLQSNEKVGRVAPDTWGLLDRDFHTSHEQRLEIGDVIASHLDRTNQGLHLSEIDLIARKYVSIPDRVSNYMILSLCQADARLKVYRGQFVGLRGWGESRRLTISDVLERDINSFMDPMPMSEIVERVSRAAGRSVTGQDVVNPLRLKGFLFDPVAKVWYSPCQSADESGDNEEYVEHAEPESTDLIREV